MDTSPNENNTAEKDSITLTQIFETEVGTIESISNYSELDAFNGTETFWVHRKYGLGCWSLCF